MSKCPSLGGIPERSLTINMWTTRWKRQFRFVDGSKTLATPLQMLMDHINSNHALHAEVHWGTLRLHHQLGVPLHSSYIWQILSVFHIYAGSSFPWYRSPNSDAIIYSATTLTRWGKNRKRRQRTRSDCSRGLSHFLIISLLPHTKTNIQNRYKKYKHNNRYKCKYKHRTRLDGFQCPLLSIPPHPM